MKQLYVSLILLILTCSEFSAQTFRLARPVKDKYPTNGSYLYAEPSISSPGNGHRGIDISIDHDTVYAAVDGVIDFVGYDPNNAGGYEPAGCGNYIFIKSVWDNKDLYLLYCHLSKPLVEFNQQVTVGEPVAISGNTGNSTGPHLHFEIRLGSRSFSASRSRRNPELWVAMEGMGAVYGYVPGAPNSTRVDIFPDPKPRPPYTNYGYSLTYNFADPYIGSDDIYHENYAIGDVKPGVYTITALNGAYQRTVTVQAGQVVNADASATDVSEDYVLTDDYILYQNYPNPFNPATTIGYQLPKESNVRIKIYDILGRETATLVNETQEAGFHKITFNGGGIPSGMYIYSLETGEHKSIKKMLLIK